MKSRSRNIQAVALVLVVSALASVGCATPDKRTYYWSNYQRSLAPGSAGGLETTLKRIITSSDETGRKTPPGLLAEYGYIFLQRGDKKSAVEYFEREANAWPESSEFMKRMIERAQQGADS